MPRKPESLQLDGAWWFTLRYAARLLGTTPRRVEMLCYAGRLQHRDHAGAIWVAETDVTALRRDPVALKTAKALARENRAVTDRARPDPAVSAYVRHPDQNVLPIADHRLHRPDKPG